MAMTPEHKQILRQTWQQVAAIGDPAAVLFYRRLFEIDATTRPLFNFTHMPAQRRKLLETLGTVVQGLDHFEILIPTIEDLGRRHVGYGVSAAHYDSVGAALLWTLAQALGEAWTPDVEAAWREAYGAIAGIMCAAAEETAPPAEKVV